MEKMYAISFGYNEKQVESHCWGKGCGGGLNGSFDISGGSFIPCRKTDCPIVEKEVELPDGKLDMFGGTYQVVVRKLKRD
jgi:hypothetical protein